MNNYEKCQNSTSENSRVFTLGDLTEKIKFFCSSIFPFPVLICSHTSLHACCNNMGTSKVTHYMQTSPDKIFFSLQNLRTSKVQLHCYTGEKLSCLVLSESMLHHSLNASWPRQMSQLQLAPMAKNMTLLGNSGIISKQEKRGNDYFYTYSTYFNCLDNCC